MIWPHERDGDGTGRNDRKQHCRRLEVLRTHSEEPAQLDLVGGQGWELQTQMQTWDTEQREPDALSRQEGANAGF